MGQLLVITDCSAYISVTGPHHPCSFCAWEDKIEEADMESTEERFLLSDLDFSHEGNHPLCPLSYILLIRQQYLKGLFAPIPKRGKWGKAAACLCRMGALQGGQTPIPPLGGCPVLAAAVCPDGPIGGAPFVQYIFCQPNKID